VRGADDYADDYDDEAISLIYKDRGKIVPPLFTEDWWLDERSRLKNVGQITSFFEFFVFLFLFFLGWTKLKVLSVSPY